MAVIQFEDGTKVNFDGTPTPQDIEEVAKQIQAKKQSTLSEPQGDGFVKGLVKDLTSPVARGAVNLMKAGQMITPGGKTGKESTSEVLPFWGKTEGVGLKNGGIFESPVENFKDSLGAGVQLASFIPLARGAAVAGKASVGLGGKLLSPLVKEGAFGGATWETGRALTEDKKLGEALLRGTVGGLTGAATGGMFGLAGVPVRGLAKKIGQNIPTPFQKRSLTNEVANQVNKALSPGTKMSGHALLNATKKYTDAMEILGTQGKQIDVVDEDGIIKKFVPGEATYGETLQALVKLKDSYYKTYSNIAKEIGDTGSALDMTDITNHLKGVASGPRMAEVKNRATQLFDEVSQLPNDPVSVMTYLQDLNSGLAAKILGRSESASRGVDLEVAKLLRTKLDDLMKASNKPQYADARRAYGALKAIEDDLVKSARQQARKMGGGLSDYVDAFAVPEILVGVITQQPGAVIGGAARSGIAAVLRMTRNKERALQKALNAGAKLNQVKRRLTQ